MDKMHDNEWTTVIGLEVHVQVNSRSKAFCDDVNRFEDTPNVNISPITLAHPGTLPRYNLYHIEAGAKLGLAFRSEINHTSYFDRKNYFYPDLPKGYQITQDYCPICVGGEFRFPLPGGAIKTIRIHHLHLEEDAGKSIHDLDPEKTLLDYNRAGVPLLEIVTEPDLRSAEEVYYFIQYLQILIRNLGISDGNMEEGSLRCDCNVSVMPKGSPELGTRCEIKNLNSKKFARQAVIYESKRQIAEIKKGNRIKQSTLLFNPDEGVTYPMRDKEEVNDYRYFNDPDLPPVTLTESDIARISASLVPTPMENILFLQTHTDLQQKEIDLIIEEQSRVEFLRDLLGAGIDARESSLLLINKIIPQLDKFNLLEHPRESVLNRISEFIHLIHSGKVSKSLAYQFLYDKIWQESSTSVEELARTAGMIISQDDNALSELIENILLDNPDKVKAYQHGKKGLIGYFMGEAMKKAKGKFDPATIKSFFEKELNT